MRIDLEKVVLQGGRFEATIPIGELEWERGEEIPVSAVALSGTIFQVRRGFEMNASLSGSVTLGCVRCLTRFEHPLAFPFYLLFVSADRPKIGETQLHAGDCDLYASGDGKVDLTVVACEQIYLQLPLKPICSEACRGLCPTCGEDLVRGTCRCGAPSGMRVV